jgi:hypothetical protein
MCEKEILDASVYVDPDEIMSHLVNLKTSGVMRGLSRGGASRCRRDGRPQGLRMKV